MKKRNRRQTDLVGIKTSKADEDRQPPEKKERTGSKRIGSERWRRFVMEPDEIVILPPRRSNG